MEPAHETPMMTIYIGHRDTARELLRKALGDTPATVCVDQNRPINEIRALLEQEQLFSQATPVVLDGVLTVFPEVLPTLCESSCDVYVIEEAIPKEVVQRLTKHGGVVHLCKPPTTKKESVDMFAFTSWYEKKKKREAWIALIEAIEKGAAPEALHGLLFWKVKDLFQKRMVDAALVREVAGMPGMVRKRGVSLQEALEQFILGPGVK
jgi:hypothetical protein